MVRSVLRSNARRVLAIIGVEDDYSRDVARTMAVSGLTHSPMSVGAQGFSNYGLPGDGVNAFTGLTAPMQNFKGVAVAVPRRSYGDDTVGALPGTGGTNVSLAWMSMGQATGTGMRG